jgi:hypothetical protein
MTIYQFIVHFVTVAVAIVTIVVSTEFGFDQCMAATHGTAPDMTPPGLRGFEEVGNALFICLPIYTVAVTCSIVMIIVFIHDFLLNISLENTFMWIPLKFLVKN